ncbi:MAG TPA: hypothetical protein PLV84_07250 [Deltaproteobacteria bacterium]|nr:hypothetical protein [Deltaproteobacteria bacterium]
MDMPPSRMDVFGEERRIMNGIPEYYLLFLFVILWFAVMYAISRIGGWSALAAHYRESTPYQGRTFRFQSASLRWMMGYNNCLAFGPGQGGLHISVAFPLRIAHPPLLIPWSEIRAERFHGRIMKGYRLRFTRCPDIPFIITERLMNRFTEAMGGINPIHENV